MKSSGNHEYTHFAPLASESKPSGSFFSRFFKRNASEPANIDRTAHDVPPPGSESVTVTRNSDITAIPEETALGMGPRRASTNVISHQDVRKEPVQRRISMHVGPASSPENTAAVPVASEVRTFSGVVKRLGNILEHRGQTPQAYKDSDFRQYWMPDAHCKQCYDCGDRFTTFRRRHHCRICGQIFCSRCCNQEVPGKIMGYTGFLRVCKYCCNIVLRFAQDMGVSELPDIRENIRQHLAGSDASSPNDNTPQGTLSRDSVTWASPAAPRRRVSRLVSMAYEDDNRGGTLRSQSMSELDLRSSQSSVFNPFDVTPQSEYSTSDVIEQERKKLLQDSAELRELWVLIASPQNGIELQSHRYHLRTYDNCLIGSKLVDWLVNNDKANSREQAKVIGQALLDAQWLECITYTDEVFRDGYCLYKPGQAALQEEELEAPSPVNAADTADPPWIRDIQGPHEDSRGDLEEFTVPLAAHEPSATRQSTFYLDPRAPEPASDARSDTSGSPYVRTRKRHVSSAASVNSDKASLFDFLQKYEDKTHPRAIPGLTQSADDSIYTYEESDYVVLESHMTSDVTVNKRMSTASASDFPVGLTKGFKRQDSCVTGLLSSVKQGSAASPSERLDMDMEPQLGWLEKNRANLREENGERLAYERLCKAQLEHMSSLTQQLLHKAGLTLKWQGVIQSLTSKVVQMVQPDVRYEGDSNDIRQYVQVKKIPGESRKDTQIISGVVCSKNTAHKKMRRRIQDPRILLLRAPIEYQRVENKFSSLEPQILQEREYLKNYVGRLASMSPDIVLVEKPVSRLAQEFILHTDITLVTNVKPSVMERVSRMTRAMILNSVDGLTSSSCLGHCKEFHMATYNLPDGKTKNLMYFDGCEGHLGCTITLRGALAPELQKVKQIVQVMTYVSYHLGLEFCYLMDAFALPPSHPDENADDLDSSPERDLQRIEENRLTSEERMALNAQVEEAHKQQFMLNSQDGGEETTFSLSFDSDSTVKENVDFVTQKETCAFDHVNPLRDTELLSPSKKPEQDISKASPVMQNKETANKLVAPVINVLDPSGSVTKQNVIRQEAKKTDQSKVSDHLKRDRIKSQASDTERSSIAVSDLSDPLNKYQVSQDESVFEAEPLQLREVKQGPCANFKKTLNDVILSISPYIRNEMPYLETDSGSKCILRPFLPPKLFSSTQFEEPKHEENSKQVKKRDKQIESSEAALKNATKKDLHFFQTTQLTKPLADPESQKMLADFRARGGRVISRHLSDPNSNQSKPVASSSTNENTSGKVATNKKKEPDCLDPVNHQKSSVLFSSFSYDANTAPGYCVSPWVVTMDFYGRNDITLGGFLDRFCFRESYHCPNDACDTPLVEHLRRFVHETGCISVLLKKLDHPFPNYQNSILMWGWCRKCKKVTPVIPMSPETWKLSFAKYLELRFHGTAYGRRASPEPCPHSIHHDHFQYFGYRNIVASFKYSPICLREIALPPMTVQLKHAPPDVIALFDASKMLNYTGTTVYCAIMDAVLKLQQDATYDGQLKLLDEYEEKVQVEKDNFRQKMEVTEQMISDLDIEESHEEQQSLLNVIRDYDTETRQLIAHTVDAWNERFEELLVLSKKPKGAPATFKSAKSTSSFLTHENTLSSDVTSTSQTAAKPDDVTSNAASGARNDENSPDTTVPMTTDATNQPINIHDGEEGLTTHASHFGSPAPLHWYNPGDTDNASTTPLPAHPSLDVLEGHGHSVSADNLGKLLHAVKVGDPIVTALPKIGSSSDLLEKGSSEKREKSTGGMKHIISSLFDDTHSVHVQMPFSNKEHQLLPPCDSIPVIIYDEEPSSIIAYSLSCTKYHQELEDLRERNKEANNQSVRRIQKNSVDTPQDSSTDSDKRSSSSKVLSFLKGSETPRESSPKRSKFDGSSVKYSAKLDKDDNEEQGGDDTDFSLFSKSDKSTSENKSKEQDFNLHIELQFQDPTTRFFCRVYYADQFAKLRKIIFPDGEERYIRSLSRCLTWLARGGKSGSKFCKTQDDRLILKQMSRPEIQSFLEFAPHYINHITKAHNDKIPTALAKILGVYRVGLRNSSSNEALKQDVLVMENLFYARKMLQIFDLKGSVRNRLVNTYGKSIQELVLLDENLLKLMVDNPLHLREHSKTVLTKAITNDTHFLSSHLIMDYSLLVGVDERSKHLVVGIIDYIRTFTWDKKVETVVKSTILNSQGKLPTVLSPELYRSRFLEAMDRYFLMVPDRWYGLSAMTTTS